MATATRPMINFHALGARLHTSFEQSHRRSPLLLILDLHGVLVQRIENHKEPELLRQTRSRRPCHMRHNRHEIWLRPYLRKFLMIISARHNVAIWSAAQPMTINPLLDEMSRITDLKPSFRERCTYILDRSKCRPDQDKRNGRFSVVKYLPDLWSLPPPRTSSTSSESTAQMPSEGPAGLDFTERNTIIVDDTFSKVRFQPNSALVLPEYNIHNYHYTYDNDDTLLWILLYLEYLIEATGLESYDDKGEKRPDDGLNSSPGIAPMRPMLLSFENFWTEGFNLAFNFSSPYQREKLQSLAYVFFPNSLVDLPNEPGSNPS